MVFEFMKKSPKQSERRPTLSRQWLSGCFRQQGLLCGISRGRRDPDPQGIPEKPN